VDPLPENLVSPGIEPRASGSIARNSNHYITEAVYDYITKGHRKNAKVIQINENANVGNTGQAEDRQRKHKRHELGDGQAYNRTSG
jgi:hypothetical protein